MTTILVRLLDVTVHGDDERDDGKSGLVVGIDLLFVHGLFEKFLLLLFERSHFLVSNDETDGKDDLDGKEGRGKACQCYLVKDDLFLQLELDR